MNEIKCPKCGATVTVDESNFAAILEQVRTREFDKEIQRRMAELQEQFKSKEENVRVKTEKEFEHRLSDKDRQMSELQNELTRLKGEISNFEATKKSALSELETSKAKELFDAVSKKDKKIADLESKIANINEAHKVAILEQKNALASDVQEKEKKIIELQSELKADKLAAQNRESQLKEQHQLQLKDKQEEIDRLKDFKLRLSTKMVGETLEQHCSILFEQAQSMGLYPDAEFCKDNIAVEGTKGDFIFRDFIDGEEYVSIMFEMKNEMDETATKHRNEDFLDKLHKDRERKNCEYAVLVSMLEKESDLYNNGIVDKSHRYPKMLVIRPQFFMPVLRLISEGARKGYMEKHELVKELETARNQSYDFARFEDKLNLFRSKISNNVEAAHKKFVAATEGIDKAIEGLEKQIKALQTVKENLVASDKKLLDADEYAEKNLTVKKLTHGNQTVRKMIEEGH